MCPNKKINYLIIEWNALAEIFNIAVKTDVALALVKNFEIDWFLLTLGGLKTSWYSSQNFKQLISLTYTMSGL